MVFLVLWSLLLCKPTHIQGQESQDHSFVYESLEEAMKDPMVNTNLMQTGLTQTEQALLSNEEKAIRLRQRGLSR